MVAAQYLRNKKYTILGAGYRCRFGEIDLIASNREYIVFVEVKLRKYTAGYLPREAVTNDKRKRLLHAAKNFIYRSKTLLQPRFDIIEITMNERQDLKDADVNWIENAF